MNNKKVNIIIPLYNKANTIERTLQSVCNCSHINYDLECIIVDDNSTDGSSDIAMKYEREYPDLFVYLKIQHKDHYNPSNARNVGIRYADGDYIRFLDADDELPPLATDTAFNYMESHPECSAHRGGTWFVSKQHLGAYQFLEWICDHFGSFLLRTHLVKQLPLFQDVQSEDDVFIINYMYHFPAVEIDFIGTTYIYHDEDCDVSVKSKEEYNSAICWQAQVIDALDKLNDGNFPYFLDTWVDEKNGYWYWAVKERSSLMDKN